MAGKFEIKVAKNGQYHFNLKAGNGQIILSSELYKTRAACENGIESIKNNAGDETRYERRTTTNGEPYFILKAKNGQEIGRSETYSSTAALENGIASVTTNAPSAEIVDRTEA